MKNKQNNTIYLKLICIFYFYFFLEPSYFTDLPSSCIDTDKELVKYSPVQEQLTGSWERWENL